MSGRLPGARNIAEFWENLCNGVESISFFSDQELLDAGVDRKVLNSKDYVKAAGMLADIDLFDATFFGFNARDAEIMDPQQRLFLECAWEALEHAGYNCRTYDGSIGVYAGGARSSYLFQNLLRNPEITKSVGSTQIAISNGTDFLTTQVSYKLNLRGPSIVIHSACSTSLVAIHVACQNLLNGECDMALAGGVAVNPAQKTGYFYREGGIASPDGHCRAFDAMAKGTVGGFGVGVVVLKTLEEALADGDHIHAIILGSAVNNDGSLKIGYAAPSIEGQSLVIKNAIAAAGVAEESVSYIEAHGTGTILGDPIEFTALQQAYGSKTKRKQYCAIGSVKTNIGHLDTAAGVTGLIKTVLSLEHGLIPPSLHFQKANPNIDFENSAFFVNTTLRKWEETKTPRRAGVSSFGIGGTNAHAILEEPPVRKSSSNSRQNHLTLLSARTEAALNASAAKLADHLRRNPTLDLADVAYTLQVGRVSFSQRRAIVADGVPDLLRALDSPSLKHSGTVNEDSAPLIAFMFTGQGSQYVEMGRGLYENERVFREEVDCCAEILREHVGYDIRELLFPHLTAIDEASQRLNETSVTQPALFVIEYALARLLMSWGIEPQAMIGHSIGEYVAATLAETLTLEDALLLVGRRGALMQRQPRGAMLSVLASAEQLRSRIGPGLELAAINAPSACVLSGSTDEIQRAEQVLTEAGYLCTRLNVSHAFHSQLMSGAVVSFEEALRNIQLKEPQIPFISNVTGAWITDHQATDPSYWGNHLRNTVRFADGISELISNDNYLLLEIGPGRTLCGLAQKCLNHGETKVLPTMRAAGQSKSDSALLLETVGQLWLAGAEIDWDGFYQDEKRCRVPLPTYPFERRRYWVNPIQAKDDRPHKTAKHDDLTSWFYVPVWKRARLVDQRAANDQRWILFVDENSLSDRLVARSGDQAVTVQAGKRYERVAERRFVIDPQQREHYAQLFRELAQLGFVPTDVAHLWNDVSDSYRGFYSLLFIAQVLGREFPGVPVRLSVVAKSVHDVIGAETIDPKVSMLLAPCKVIPQEYPNVICRFFDVGDDSDDLIAELLTPVDRERVDRIVAYRHGRRWVQEFESCALEPVTENIQLRERGVYLITGGLGKVGLSLAESLAKKYAAKLVLISRSAVSDAVMNRVRSFKEFGGEVIVVQADVTNKTQMRTVVDKACASFAQINGVIHCAGLSARKSIQEVTAQECESIFAAKVQGLVTLRKVLQDQPPQFVLLMSSLSTVVGGLGFVAYAAANLFMDAFATRWNGVDGVRWTSVCWDGWRFVEETADRNGSDKAGSGLGMTPAQGVEAFERIMNCRGLPVVAVSSGDLHVRIRQWVTMESVNGHEPAREDRSELHERPVLKTTYVAPADATENKIAEIWESLLGIDRVGIQDNFFDLGGHSLIAIQIISRLREAFSIELPIRCIFEAPTISELASLVTQKTFEQKNEQIAAMRVVPHHIASIDEILLNLNEPGEVKDKRLN
jgi:acyl transferase domain-containing protein